MITLNEEKQIISFEEALNELQLVVDKLEQGDVPLEEAISMFQQGMQLSKVCHDKLAVVERQLEQILNEDIDGIEVIQVQEDLDKS